MPKKPTVLLLIETNEPLVDALRAAGAGEVRVGPTVDDIGQTVDPALLSGVECILCDYLPANLDDCDRLKWVQLASAGYSQIFGLPLVKRGIRASNGLGNFDVPMAEWNVMMLILWQRRMREMLDNQRQAIWDRSARFQSELRGSVVGFFGYGGMARETARLVRHMGLEVWALTRDGSVKPRDNTYRVAGTGDPDGTLCHRTFRMADKAEFLAGLDYLILAMPITPVTTDIVTEADLRQLKPSAVLINPARAKLIDEDVLIRCLQENWIRGASLDVHYAYPLPPEHPLWHMPNVILTPHISGSGQSSHFQERIFDIFTQNLTRYISGHPLLNELTAPQMEGQV